MKAASQTPRTKLVAAWAIATAIACSCSPVRRIDMKNTGNDTVAFTWTLNEDSLSNNPFLLSNSKELTFLLYPPRRNEIKMSFGAGNWSPAQVEKLVNHLVSLEIKSATQYMKIDSLPLLKTFLLARRKGIGGGRIEIAAN
ncbi:MAG TPA: hypothetical protein VMR70_06860 [Flavisolibacter sp.]|nr:hypothetical protein [Flavisolibacter sp.]